MEVRRDHCVIGLKPTDGEYASADTEAAKVAAVEEFVQKYLENIGVRPSKNNTAWVEKKLGIDLANDVRVCLRKVHNCKKEPGSRCAKVEALNNLCGKQLIHHETVAQRGSPVLPSRAANDWRPLVFEPIEQRRYQPKHTTESSQRPVPTPETSNATDSQTYVCSGGLRAAEQKLQALALNRTRQERARDAAREAHVIEATRLSTEGSDNMHAGQNAAVSGAGCGDHDTANGAPHEEVEVTEECGRIPVPVVVLQHRRRIHALSNRKCLSVLGGSMSAKVNDEQYTGTELGGFLTAIPESSDRSSGTL